MSSSGAFLVGRADAEYSFGHDPSLARIHENTPFVADPAPAGATMKVAAIDIGSNSIHMVVARIDAGGHFTLLDRAKEPVRLGRGTLTSRALSSTAMQTGLETLATFKRLADTLQAEKILSVATSAVRESKNGGDFISQIGRTLGIHVDVITGREEARLIYLAVSNALDLRNETVLLADVGGGSVELVLAEGAASACKRA